MKTISIQATAPSMWWDQLTILDHVASAARAIAAVVVAHPLPTAALSALLLLGALIIVLAARTRPARTELVSRSLAEAKREREEGVR